jgi:uncharacterized hydrophobic protein (TIGR00341 family)
VFRLIEVLAPAQARDKLVEALASTEALSRWPMFEADGKVCARLLVDVESSGDWIDAIETALAGIEGYRLVLLPVEATVPRPVVEEQVVADADKGAHSRGVSRDELIEELQGGIELGFNYFAFIVVSVLVAIVGLVYDNVAVIIGAMVLAPLLTPNVALALATTLGDLPLARKALLAGSLGACLALLIAVAIGAGIDLPLGSEQMQLRAQVSIGDVLVALAAGAAGVLALTGGASASLIGVMVAVALMPPLVAAGLFAGAMRWNEAYAAGGLFTVNLLAVNLAGVICFLIRGIRPRGWWQAAKAERGAWIAVTVWLILLAALLALLRATGVMGLLARV